MILGITITAARRQMKSTKILPARSDKGCSGSLVTRCLKSITNHNLLRATFSMSSFFGPPKKVWSMLRKRDLSALSDLTEAHKRAICQNPEILQLRREKRELMAEMRSVAGTIKNARDTFPHLF
ncbi:hypothetical protein N7499_004147 [Penicillium canescens]|nr:hypothetical protein N7499_004147 [Penicillium canescens]